MDNTKFKAGCRKRPNTSRHRPWGPGFGAARSSGTVLQLSGVQVSGMTSWKSPIGRAGARGTANLDEGQGDLTGCEWEQECKSGYVEVGKGSGMDGGFDEWAGLGAFGDRLPSSLV